MARLLAALLLHVLGPLLGIAVAAATGPLRPRRVLAGAALGALGVAALAAGFVRLVDPFETRGPPWPAWAIAMAVAAYAFADGLLLGAAFLALRRRLGRVSRMSGRR